MEHQRAEKYDVDKLRQDTEEFLTTEYKPSSLTKIRNTKFGKDNELEILSDIWGFVAENIEREEWKSYTREDWEELERNYVERADYTEPDLFDDILTKYERGLFTADEAQAYAKRYRKCRYRFCENVFKPRRKNQYYCPDSNCRNREANSKQRFKETGTYLPPHVYKELREDTRQRNYERWEVAQDIEIIEEVYIPQQYKNEYGGERDRAREDMYDIARYKQNKEIDAETLGSPLIRHYKPVTIEDTKVV